MPPDVPTEATKFAVVFGRLGDLYLTRKRANVQESIDQDPEPKVVRAMSTTTRRDLFRGLIESQGAVMRVTKLLETFVRRLQYLVTSTSGAVSEMIPVGLAGLLIATRYGNDVNTVLNKRVYSSVKSSAAGGSSEQDKPLTIFSNGFVQGKEAVVVHVAQGKMPQSRFPLLNFARCNLC